VNALGSIIPDQQRHQKADQKTLHVSNLFITLSGLAGQKLVELSGLEKAFFCNSGTEAIEAAIKLARGHSYKNHLGEAKHENSRSEMPFTAEPAGLFQQRL
jgi:acetylornithine/succinyldiaminopimelate/putrescine aminotransferase